MLGLGFPIAESQTSGTLQRIIHGATTSWWWMSWMPLRRNPKQNKPCGFCALTIWGPQLLLYFCVSVHVLVSQVPVPFVMWRFGISSVRFCHPELNLHLLTKLPAVYVFLNNQKVTCHELEKHQKKFSWCFMSQSFTHSPANLFWAWTRLRQCFSPELCVICRGVDLTHNMQVSIAANTFGLLMYRSP